MSQFDMEAGKMPTGAVEGGASGLDVRNFPPFLPLIHHDIARDIPEERKHIQWCAFITWMGIMVCLFWNFICATAAWIAGTFFFTNAIGTWFLTLIYLLAGVPLSYFLWYRPLYTAMRKQGWVSFTLFFINYTIHIAFCIFASIAAPFLWNGWSFTGWWATIDIFMAKWIVIGILYAVGATAFTCESALSIYVMGRVIAHCRGRA